MKALRFFLVIAVTLLMFVNNVYSQIIHYNIDFSSENFTTRVVEGYTFISANEKGFTYREIPGYPALPVRVVTLAIPNHTVYADYNIDIESNSYLNDVTVYPFQPPVPTDGSVTPWVKPNSAVYGSDGVFPTGNFQYTSSQDQGQYRFITFEICPFKYFPSEKRVELITHISLDLTLVSGEPNTNRPDDGTMYSLLQRVVDNPEALAMPNSKSPVNPNDVKYLIITDANMVDDFQPLADWKTQKGIPAEVISLQSILANYTGATDQLKIKTCLQDYYTNKGLQWVLLGGDNTVVPDQDCYGIVNATSATPTIDNTIPTDLFYCCFNNAFDWNADGDTQVGEIEDNVDMAPEIFIGRAPVQTESQAVNFVAKTLNYEQNPPANNFASNYVSSGLQLWNTWGGHSDADWRSEAIWNEIIAPIWTGIKYNYYDTDTDFAGGNTYDITAQHTSDLLNDGYNYFWMATHGGQQTWGMEMGNDFSSSDAAALTNLNRQGLVITMACNTNAFETSKYVDDPCLSEAFLRNGNGGAVMYHGSSRYGWGNGDAVVQHGTSMEFARDFFYALFMGNPSSQPQSFAAVSAESKLDNIGNAASANSYRWLMFSINNMGDPELPIFTQNPSGFVASIPPYALYGVPQNIEVGTGVPGSLVCIMDANDANPVYTYGYADSNGSCTLQVTPSQDYALTITISAPNHYPCVSTINTIPATDPFVVVDEIMPSTTNGDATIEAGETAYFDVRIINYGGITANNIVMQLAKTDPNNFITLTDSNESVAQSLPAGDTLMVTAAFSLDVAMDVTNNYEITLSTGITFSSKDMTWYPQDFTVYSYIDPIYLTSISGNQRVDLSWRAPFGGWKSFYPGGGWFAHDRPQRAMLYQAADFDLSYPIEIFSLASRFSEYESWGGNNTFRFNIYDATTEELFYQSDWIVASSFDYTYYYMDYPITLTDDFYLAVEVNDLTNGYPVSVVSAPMDPEDTHCYVGSPWNWTKATFECSSYIYVMDAGSTATKELSYQQNQLTQQNPASDLTLGKSPKFSFQGYNVYRDNIKLNSTLFTDNSYTDEPLTPDLYSYSVTAVYAEGESCSSNEVIAASLDANTIFYDHFDGTNFWTCDDGCSWNNTANEFYSATASYTDSPDGNYQDNMDCSTWTANPVSLMNINADMATVSYYAKYAIEEDYDTCFFEITTDIDTGTRDILGYYTGINNVWTEYSFDISNYIGNDAIYFIFRMNTDQMVTDDGIYIDDFKVTVAENGFAPARDIEANLYDIDVHLSWSPPMSGGEGWFSHWRWSTHYALSGSEKGAYINLAEFGNAYPMMLEKIKHQFYDPNNNNWNGNNRFTFRIYNKNGIDLVYESPQIEAVAWVNEYTLPVPFELTDDVLIAVAPVSSAGGPYSLFQADWGNSSRSYIGDAIMGWNQKNGNWTTEIYITNSSKSDNALWNQSGVALQNVNSEVTDVTMLPVPAKDLKKAPRFTGNQNLAKNVQGYNIYRNESQLNSALVTNNWFIDELPYQGVYNYTVKAVYSGGESVETMPQYIELDDVVVMIPPVATAFDEVTLWFDPAYSCEAGSANSLEDFGEVWLHSGMGINGTTWNNVVPWDNLGVNSQSPQLALNGNGQASITYTPSEFYGTSVDQTLQDQLCMVFNGGNLAQTQFSNPWEKTGKITDEYGNCADIFIPLEYRDTLFMDDFESGISKWSVSGDWALCEAEFFSPTHSLTDSPDGNYSSPSDTYATMANSVDFSQKANIVLEFKTIFGLNEDDFVYVEASNDDFASSDVIYTFSNSNWKPWDDVIIDLDSYSGFDNVKIRFHMVVQNSNTDNGIFIDDVLIKAVDGYFMIADIIPHTTDGDANFEANETATLDVVIVNGGALSLSNIPLTLSKTDADGYLTLTDNVCTIESINPGERDTIFDAFSLDVAIGVTTSYPFTLSVGADIPSEDMQWFDFDFFAFSNLYPINLVAENGNNEVSLSWLAPFRGWYTYQSGGNQGTHWSEEERATLIQASDFGLTYPLYFSSIAHRFFEVPENPWNGNNTFRYNLYDYTAGTLLYQSDWIQAPADDYGYFDFDEPMLVNADFFISVEVQDAGNSNFPSSCRNEGTTHPQSHSYLGTSGNWVTYPHEWITYLFITGDGGVNGTSDNLAVGYDNGSPMSGIPEDLLPKNGKSGNAKSDIIGFNIYRDGTKINGEQPLNEYSYLDSNLSLGSYSYQATAVYNAGESCFSNIATANLTDPDVVFFEDFEGYNGEDWDCGWDFTEVDSHSSSHSLANGPNGNYADNQNCYVKVDPPVHLLNINADSAVLSFWAKYDIEENVDTCFLEVTSDFWGSEHVPIGFFTGTNTSWQEYSFDVSNFIGKSLVYIFRMKTNESINFDGIYIDDVTIRVYGNDNAPARNFEAFAYGADVHLEWEVPMVGGEGWFSNWRWTTAYTINNTEMASYFDMSEFGNSYPMKLEKIKHHFYDANGDDWGGQDQYIIKIYEKDGSTVLYESGNLFADNGANEFILPTPLELTDDVLISIVPATTYPSSCLMNDVNNPSHGYMGNFDEGWTSINGNFATEIYVTYPGAKTAQGKYWGISGVELGNLCEEVLDNTGIISIPADVQATLPKFKGNTSLAKNVNGYNVYCNGNQVNTDPVTNSYYYDTIPHQGVYDYYVKALYTGGESVGTVNNEFSINDVVLSYPLDATPSDSITLWFAPEYSCEAGQSYSLEGSSEVRLHSGVGVDGSYWSNTISWEGPGINGQSTLLDIQPNDLYSISLRPTGFYGVDPESEIVDHLIMTFNGGYSTPAPYDKTGMAPDGTGGCMDIIKDLNYRSVIFEDDFESGLNNWALTGNWGVSDSEFYTATHSLSDSPYNWYWGQSETSATMDNGVSLVGYVHALLEFNFMHGLGSGDEVSCEISTNDFQSYDVLETYTYWDWKPWKHASLSLENYANHTNVKIRFRLVTNESDDGDGIYVDDFTIKGYYEESLIENIPYNQDFTVYPTPDWNMYAGQLTANSTLTPYTVTSSWDGWHEDGFGCSGGSSGSIRGNLYSSNHYFWYNTPFIDLGETPQDLILRFDMSGNNWSNCTQATLMVDDHFAVVISTDGVTWSDANTLIEWAQGDTFPVYGETYQVDLTGYSGTVKFGFYHGHNSNNTDIEVFVDNVFVGIDDTPMTIAEARLLPVGTEVTLTGVVSNGDELGNIRYFQDATAGIAAYGTVQAGTIYRGDQVTYNGVLMDYNGLLEIQPINNMTVLASGVALANPVDIEPSDYSEALESQLVVTDTAFFVTPDLIFTFDLHQYVGSQGDTGVVYPRYSSNLFEKAIPDCPVAITGILSQYSPTDPTAGYRVMLRDTFDIVLLPLPVRNGSAIANNNDVAVSWDIPIAGQNIPGLDGYNIYRAISHTAPFASAQKLNDDLLQTLSYQDVDIPSDNYSYWIETVYDEGVVGLSDRLPVVVIGTVVISGYVTEDVGSAPIQNALVSFGTEATSVLTDVDGYYEQNVLSGATFLSSVTLTNYSFTPASVSFINQTTDVTQDYVGTSALKTVSGYVRLADNTPVDNVLVSAVYPSHSSGTHTNSSGLYTFQVPTGVDVTLSCELIGYTFTPEELFYASLSSNIYDANFTALETTVTISGNVSDGVVGVPDVLITFTNITGTATTDNSGNYSLQVPYGYTGLAVPQKADFTFTPANISYYEILTDQLSQDYTANSTATFSISGTITDGAAPLPGVLVSLSNSGGSTTTGADGTYSLVVNYGYSGEIIPALTGYTFSPESYSYSNVVADYIDQDFEGNSSGFPPGWDFIDTGSNHTLNVQSTAPSIDGIPLSLGSFIGVFYMDNGVEKCGGAIEWQGVDSPILPAYGDDATTPDKDGFSEGEDIIWKFFTSDVKGTELYATAIYSMGPSVYQTNGSSVIPSVQANTFISQTVALSDGWSGISSYVIPQNDSTEVLFASVSADLIILKNMTQAYWPPYANQIAHWNTYEGYKLKMNNSGEITFTGIDSDKSMTIANGWSLLPVLTNQNVEVLSFFAPVLNDLVIVKSIDGLGVYWPEVGVQTLLSLVPGKSYMVKMNSSGVLNFPALSSKQYTNEPGYPEPVASKIWNNPVNTSITHTLVFTDAACGAFADGDQIGAFNYLGVCMGIAEYKTGSPLSLCVYGDDPLTIVIDGYLHNEAFELKKLNSNELSVDLLTATFSNKQGLTNHFIENGLSLVVDVQSSPNGIESFDLNNAVVYPNPTNDILNIRLVGNTSAEVTASILTLQGGVMMEKSFTDETEIHMHTLSSGIYLLQLRDADGYCVYQRITKQ